MKSGLSLFISQITILRLILTVFATLALLPMCANAGENVVLYDAAGKLLKPAQLGNVSITKTCGACHDVAASAKSVHFNRKNKAANPDSTDCLACHLSAKNAFGSDGALLKVQPIPKNENCENCHSDIKASPSHPKIADNNMSCVGCHKDAGHRTEPNASTFGSLRKNVLKPAAFWIFTVSIALCIIHYITFGPKKRENSTDGSEMLRFSFIERFVHWLAMGSFAFLAVSGVLFLFHIKLPVHNLREVHEHVGLLFVISVIGMVACWWKNARFVSCDKDWLCKLGGYFWINGECPSEKFNAGQKIFFWGVVGVLGALISITGFILTRDKGSVSAIVFILHDLAAIGLIVAIIGHTYLSVFANPGSLSGIITGKVARSWAQKYHPHWRNK